MPRDPLIGLVGKPSSGKSTTLNSFTTIDPQRAIGYLQIECACARLGVSDKCKPNYGGCVDGRRSVPIELLDVAGLVPGAHMGKGLGNRFLDDLRHADALVHVVDRCLDKLQIKEPLQDWSNETIERVVHAFTDEKFPTVIALNKIDHPDADKNIAKIAKQQDPKTLVLTSAISEVFLRRLAKQGYIRYTEGSEFVDTREDLIEEGDPDGGGLKEMDEKLKQRIENLKDMVLYRFGSTGVVQVLSRAAELLGLVPVFPVRNIHTFSSGSSDNKAVFRDCVLVKKGSSVGDVYRKVMGDAPLAYAETTGGIKVAEDDPVSVGKNDVLSFKVGR
ncbi:putative gtp-binding protein [Neofusicoccum parvum UCRNP2]|uniref:Putative gtp-binding protein n=1 Tax=Botryosphaeria parva (strain UCR-NP2) TaxID=1287680 RepID=R1GRR9_BOTPV|nr:putative gtp-binding protein [Neofusicoccum parvum UCRNP2]